MLVLVIPMLCCLRDAVGAVPGRDGDEAGSAAAYRQSRTLKDSCKVARTRKLGSRGCAFEPRRFCGRILIWKPVKLLYKHVNKINLCLFDSSAFCLGHLGSCDALGNALRSQFSSEQMTSLNRILSSVSRLVATIKATQRDIRRAVGGVDKLARLAARGWVG